MRNIGAAVLVTGITLLALAAITLSAYDRAILTSPPEAVTEGFVRKLVGGRYHVSKEQLSDELRARTAESGLEQLAHRLVARTGPIEDVEGDSAQIEGNHAEAVTTLTTVSGRKVPIRLHLVYRRGAWEIDDLAGLQQAANAGKGAQES